MDFSLSSSLVGSAVLSADKLALDLQFATDKTLTARKGPTPAFARGSIGTFVGSNGLIQTAIAGAPRFDHNSISPFVCKGLLIEEQRTNLLIRSEAFNESATWTPVRLTSQPTADTEVSPDGATTAERITPDSTINNTHRIDRASLSLALNTVHSFSIFAKSNGYTGFAIGVDAASPVLGAQFSLVGNGSVTATTAGYTATITPYPNGWYKCTATFTSSVTIASHRVYMFVGQNGTTFTYTGDTTSGIILWGAQLEAGAFASSYIPTTTGTLARSADVCNISGTAFSGFYNNTQGTLVTNAAALGFSTAQNPVVSIENGTTQVMRLRYVGVTNRLSAIVSTVGLTPASNYDVVNTFYKAALSAGATGADFVINGTQIPDTYTGSVLTADNMKISVSAAGSTNTCVASIRYYQKRLPVAKLQAFTA